MYIVSTGFSLIIRVTGLVMVFFAIIPANVLAFDSSVQTQNQSKTIEIYAEKAVMDYKIGIANFEKNVKVINGKSVITSSKMNVIYKNNAIKTILFPTHLVITTEKFNASGDSGVYDVVNSVITINNNVIFNDNLSSLKATKLVYDMKTKIYELTGNQAEQIEIIIDQKSDLAKEGQKNKSKN